MRLIRILRSTPVYLLLKLAVLIYACVWAYRVNESIPLDGMTRHVAIAAIAVILWGRIRNLMIRIHPLDGESVVQDIWILQLYPRLLCIAVIWLAAEAQAVEPRADFMLAVFAACTVLALRPVWLVNFLVGPAVILVGGILAFIGDSYYRPTDHSLMIAGGLLVLLGLEAIVHTLIYLMGNSRRIENRTTEARKGEKVRESRRRRWEGKRAPVVGTRDVMDDYESYLSDVRSRNPHLQISRELEELQTQIELRGLEGELRAKGLYPGTEDFPIDAIPWRIREQLRGSNDLRKSGYGRPTYSLVGDADLTPVGAEASGPEWAGLKRWTVRDLEEWKREWIDDQAKLS